jgi:hypothetical protein
MKLPPMIASRNQARLPMAKSPRNMYRIAFFACAATWLYTPSLAQSDAIPRIAGIGVALTSFQVQVISMIALLAMIAMGVLWYRESRRMNVIISNTVGGIDFHDLPLIDKTSAASGVKRVLGRWVLVALCAAVIVAVLIRIDIGSLISNSNVALYVFMFTLMASATVAAYIIMDAPKIDIDTMLARFAQRNHLQFHRANDVPLWLNEAVGDSSPLVVNWVISGEYRLHDIEVVFVSWGDRYTPAYIVRVLPAVNEGVWADVNLDSMNDLMWQYDGVAYRINEGERVACVAATDSVYNRAAVSRVFAVIDVLIDGS